MAKSLCPLLVMLTVNHASVAIFNVAKMSSNAILENKILAIFFRISVQDDEVSARLPTLRFK